jgi:hypothetical protein
LLAVCHYARPSGTRQVTRSCTSCTCRSSNCVCPPDKRFRFAPKQMRYLCTAPAHPVPAVLVHPCTSLRYAPISQQKIHFPILTDFKGLR